MSDEKYNFSLLNKFMHTSPVFLHWILKKISGIILKNLFQEVKRFGSEILGYITDLWA